MVATMATMLTAFIVGLFVAAILNLESKLKASSEVVSLPLGFLVAFVPGILLTITLLVVRDLDNTPVFWTGVLYFGGTALYALRCGYKVWCNHSD